jgi:hypothetical protein
MAGRMSRNKGANGEREVIGLLQPVVDRVCAECGQVQLVLKRNYSQRFAAKQYDVEGVPWMALEVKRVENQSGVGSWWRQTLAATRPGQVPVLFYRQNHRPWMVRTRLPVVAGGRTVVRCTVTMDVTSFLVWFEYRLKSDWR